MGGESCSVKLGLNGHTWDRQFLFAIAVIKVLKCTLGNRSNNFTYLLLPRNHGRKNCLVICFFSIALRYSSHNL